MKILFCLTCQEYKFSDLLPWDEGEQYCGVCADNINVMILVKNDDPIDAAYQHIDSVCQCEDYPCCGH